MGKEFVFYKGTLANLAADGLVEFAGAGIDGKSVSIPLYKEIPDWERIVIDVAVASITGTNVVFKAVSLANINTDVTASSPVAKLQDGSTDFASATITAAGTYRMVCNKKSGAAATTSTVAGILGLLADVSSVTDLDAEISILVTV